MVILQPLVNLSEERSKNAGGILASRGSRFSATYRLRAQFIEGGTGAKWAKSNVR